MHIFISRPESSSEFIYHGGFIYHGSFNLSKEEREALNLPLTENSTYFIHTIVKFNTSSEPGTTTTQIHVNSPEVSTTSTNLKFEVWKYFNKIIVDGVRRAQCKLFPDISYAFLKNTETNQLSRHIKSKHPEHQPWQTQISILSGTLGTFTYSRVTGKTNLAKYLIQFEQPFSMAEDNAFTN